MLKYRKITVPKKKRIALVAHDRKKEELFAWVARNTDRLKHHTLMGTGTTATLIQKKFHLDITPFLSGPLGGDQMVGAKIATNEIDILIFFWDPLEAQPHDPDVKALLRIAVLYDVPVFMSPSASEYLFLSNRINESYEKYILDKDDNIEDRVEMFYDDRI